MLVFRTLYVQENLIPATVDGTTIRDHAIDQYLTTADVVTLTIAGVDWIIV